jgi:adenine/guanine phosphoribosyltransferase-like PRPP-binding protein
MVDDVRTTGATAGAAATALREAGAARVLAITLAAVRNPNESSADPLVQAYDT